MKRLLVLVLLAGSLAAIPTAGAAVNGDGGSNCENLNNLPPEVNPQLNTRGWSFTGSSFSQGDIITMSVEPPTDGTPTEAVFIVDGLGTVDSAPFPGTVSWTVPSAGPWNFRVATIPLEGDGYGTYTAKYTVGCTPAPEPKVLFCFGFPATIIGTGGDDVLVGTAGRDVIAALGGDDEVRALGGDDLICGGNGDDRLYGGGGNDRLRGGDGSDVLFGRLGDDWLGGGDGPDVANGGLGTDNCLAETRSLCE